MDLWWPCLPLLSSVIVALVVFTLPLLQHSQRQERTRLGVSLFWFTGCGVTLSHTQNWWFKFQELELIRELDFGKRIRMVKCGKKGVQRFWAPSGWDCVGGKQQSTNSSCFLPNAEQSLGGSYEVRDCISSFPLALGYFYSDTWVYLYSSLGISREKKCKTSKLGG